MDYFDIMEDSVFEYGRCAVVDGLTPRRLRAAADGEGWLYKVQIPFTDELARHGVSAHAVSFFGHGIFPRYGRTPRWVRIDAAHYDAELDRWVMQEGQNTYDFHAWLHQAGSRFISFGLRCRASSSDQSHMGKMRRHLYHHLDWQSAWNIEVTVRRAPLYGRHRNPGGYEILRPSRTLEQRGLNFAFKDYPDFEYRRRHFPGYVELAESDNVSGGA